MVECRFTSPADEQAWNAWYSGPRIGELLAVPGFLTSQRFRSVTRSPSDYLAVHSIASLDVFSTPEYKAMGGGGFSHFPEHITDWVRRFFTGLIEMPAVVEGHCVVMADGGRSSVAGLPVRFEWVQPVGSDDVRGERGIAVIPMQQAKAVLAGAGAPVEVYEPIMVQRRSMPLVTTPAN